MARDYVKATRPKASAKIRIWWLWLLLGLLLCGVGGGAYYWMLTNKTPDRPMMSKPKTTQKKQIALVKPRFEFYKMLPNMQVDLAIPEANTKVVNAQTAHAPKPILPKKIASESTVGYMLQVSSFREKIDAKRLIEQLRTQFIKAHIHQINHDDMIWYRVYVGPFDTRDHAKKEQVKIQALNFEPFILMVEHS